MQKETFLSHPVFEKLEQLKQVLSNDENRKKIDLENLSFYETFYSYCKDKLNLTIPTLVQEAELNNLLNEIEAANVQINNFLGNTNIGHLNNATNNFNSALTRIKNLPFAITKGDFNFSNSIANFQKIVQEKYEGIQATNVELQTELTALQNQLSDKNAQLEIFGNTIKEKDLEIKNILTRYNTEFESLKTEANSSIEKDREGFTEEFENDKGEYQRKFETVVKALNDSAFQTINELQSKLDEAKKIVNVVGNVGVTGNYQNIANQNKTSANVWRTIAIFFMAIMTGLLIWSIIDLSKAGFDLYKSIVRIIAAAVLTYPAIYAARESSKHRNLETKNRNLELELASIGPFIEILPEAKKQEIKAELVKHYFSNNKGADVDKSEDIDVSINTLERIAKLVQPFLKK